MNLTTYYRRVYGFPPLHRPATSRFWWFRLLFVLLVVMLPDFARAATITSTATGGNLTAGGSWVGGVAPVSGTDSFIVAASATVHVNANFVAGNSPPQTPVIIPFINVAVGAGTTSLAGVYQFRYASVDAGGGISQPTTNIGTGTLVGTNKPRVFFPSIPAGISSYKFYLSAAGTGSGTEHLYANVTGATVGASAAVKVAGGSGYVVGDTITLAGGTSTTATVLTVASVTGGAITGITLTTSGTYTVAPSSPVAQASTSGTGSGATFTTTYQPFVDLIANAWTDGGTTYAAATVVNLTAYAVQVNGGGFLDFSGAFKLTARGDVLLSDTGGSSTFTGGAGATLEFDPSASNSPANTSYSLTFGDANNATTKFGKLRTSGTSAGSPFTIQTNAVAGNAVARCTIGSGNFGAWSDCVDVNVAYVNFNNIGDPTYDAFTFSPNSVAVQEVFDHCIFLKCGRTFWSTCGVICGWNYSNCTWKQSNGKLEIVAPFTRVCPLILAASANPTTGTRALTNCVFDGVPSLVGFGNTTSGCVFYQGWNGNAGTKKSNMDLCLIRETFPGNSEVSLPGDLTNSVVIGDNLSTMVAGTVTVNTPAVSGTMTSVGASSFQDSSKTMARGQYAAFGVPPTGLVFTNPYSLLPIGQDPNGYFVLVTSGPGAGQCRAVNMNSASSDTPVSTFYLNETWDTPIPTTASTYAVFDGQANPHFLSYLGSDLVSQFNYTGNIMWFAGADNNGDGLLHCNVNGQTYNIKNNIWLPSLARENSCTPGTLGNTGTTANYVFEHNTYFTGGQSLSVGEGGGTAGEVISFKSNLSWCDNVRTLASNQAGYTGAGLLGATNFVYTSQPIPPANPSSTTLGPFKVCDTNGVVNGSSPLDYILVTGGTTSLADYNCGYGYRVGYSDTNNGSHGGYNLRSSVVMGTHDVNVNPGFPDPWRNPCTWGESLGVTGHKLQVLATVFQNIMAMNDRSGYDARFTISALATYIKAGYNPSNVALQNAGHDGVDIGALPYQALFSLFLRRGTGGRAHSRTIH